MNCKMTVVFLFFFLVLASVSEAEKAWQPLNSGLNELDVRSISIFPGDNNFICAACKNSAYFSENGGKSWRNLFSLAAEGQEINFVTFACADPMVIYVATNKGLFLTKNQGRDWQETFRGVGEEAKSVRWIALDCADGGKIYLGTKEGLYLSLDSGVNWQKVGDGLPRSEIKSIAVHPTNPGELYLANTYGLFKTIDSGKTWQRIYVTSSQANDAAEEEDEDTALEISEEQNLINCIFVDKLNPKKILLATGQGVFASLDEGQSWGRLPLEGLTCDFIKFIIGSKDGVVYAATKKGVFAFSAEKNSWQEIYQGMSARDVRCLSLDISEKQLFAGTDKGIFKMVGINNNQKQNAKEMNAESLLKELALNEPTIQEVQEAALRYAEVIHPQNIKNLRRNAKLKALLPDVTIDYDKTIQEGGTGTHFGDFVVGPRDWGLSFSWNIGDMIFSEQVRLIDSNTRLMVQLRDDILNEVTRIYYERRKLQTELILAPPNTTQESFNKKLRLEELTANIDALTGGYFSRHLKK